LTLGSWILDLGSTVASPGIASAQGWPRNDFFSFNQPFLCAPPRTLWLNRRF
jgi:hypothetical protein